MKSAGPVISAMVLVPFMLVVLYVLSIGLAIWFHERGILVREIETTAAPLPTGSAACGGGSACG